MNQKEQNGKKISNPFATGGGGFHFEAHVQASFVALMLTGGYAPSLPCWPIKEIKLQGKNAGFDTDDLIVFVEKTDKSERRRLLGQVKHSISITQGSAILSEVIQAMWNDFNNSKVFTKGKDIIALITGPLSATDTHNVQWLLNQAKHTKDVYEFNNNVSLANFSPSKSKEKLEVFQYHLNKANRGTEVSKEKLYSFLNHFHWLGYDLDKEIGVVLSLLHSHISQFNSESPQWIWSRVVDIVQAWNQDAGTITIERLPDDLKDAFVVQPITIIPAGIAEKLPPEEVEPKVTTHPSELALANLIGSWDEGNVEDKKVIEELAKEEYAKWIGKIRENLEND